MSDSSARKKKQSGLTGDAFVRLLAWLDEDRDRAGRKYEQIRSGLIKVFWYRGCTMPEELTDETIDRVALKAGQIAASYAGDPALYFFGVAKNVYLEHARRKELLSGPLPDDLPDETRPVEEEDNLAYQCLEQCMVPISAQNRKLIVAYYAGSDDGQRKMDRRKEMAEEMGIGSNALWIRVHRIKKSLRKCVSECIERKKA